MFVNDVRPKRRKNNQVQRIVKRPAGVEREGGAKRRNDRTKPAGRRVEERSSPAKVLLNLIRTFPSENRHGNVVGTVQIPLHLRLQVREGIEAQIIVKPFLVVPMTPFHFSVMPRCPRSDQFVPDAVSVAKHIQGVDAACFRRMRKLPAVICLQDTRSIAEEQNRPFEKVYGGKVAVFLICIEKPFPGRFLYDRILIEFLPILAGITGIRHIFDIHLPFFADRGRCIVCSGVFGLFLCGFGFLPESETDEYAV